MERDSARSRSEKFAYRLLLALLFFAGATAGVWVSIRYFDEPVADPEASAATPRAPGRVSKGIPIPTWLDHPFRRRQNGYLRDFGYQAVVFDLNRFFFGEAVAAIPADATPFAGDYDARRARGLLNADHERVYQRESRETARATLDRIGREGGRRTLASLREGLRDDEARLGSGAIQAPGLVLYFAAAVAAGRPIRARVGDATTIRTHATGRDDYRFWLDHRVASWGLGVTTAYDSIERRRSVALTQELATGLAVGVGRAHSAAPDGRARENTVHFTFSAPF